MVILGFDDNYIQEWYDLKDLFAKYNSTATFYCCKMDKYTQKEWDILKELQDLGHTIGYHGLNHLRAGAVENEEVFNKIKAKGQWHEDYTSWTKFIVHEIEWGLDIMLSHKLDVNHYSYPYGNCSPFTHLELERWFTTLRTGGNNNYTLEQLKKIRLLPGQSFGKKPNQKWSGYESRIKSLITNNLCGVFYMHKPIIHRLEWLLKLCKQNNTRTSGLKEIYGK